MTIDYLTIFLLIVSGFGSGLFIGMGSGTTGTIMITFLAVFMGQSIHRAIGTSLMIDCIIGGIAGLIYIKHRNVDLRPGLLLAFTGVIGAFIGSRFTSSAPASGLIIIIGFVMIAFGANFLINGFQKNIDFVESRINFKRLLKHKTIFLFVMGLFLGFACGFMGIGIAGIVGLTLIFVFGYEIHKAVGTALIMMFFISGSGTIGHIINNEVIYTAVIIAGSSAAIGAVSGSLVANKINEDKLGRLIGTIILILGTIILLKYFLI